MDPNQLLALTPEKSHAITGLPVNGYERSGSWKFQRLQRRRSQTEGRVGIFKNVFLGGRLRSKGFAHRDLRVTWTVLVHNLWVLARLQRAAAAQARCRAAA